MRNGVVHEFTLQENSLGLFLYLCPLAVFLNCLAIVSQIRSNHNHKVQMKLLA